MTEDRFNELMERIPVMEEKLERLLLTFNKIVESGNFMGVTQSDEFPCFKHTEEKVKADKELLDLSDEKLAAAKILQDEANDIREQLGI